MTNLTQTDQFKNGKEVEAWLDLYFRDRFTIWQTTSHEERALCLGDRKYSKGDKIFYVEYKSGKQTFFTGNVFLEIISNDTACAPGWVYTCQADFILYAALLNHKILVFRPEKLRAKIADLKIKFRIGKTDIQNSYHTHGVLVPLDYAEKNLAEKVIVLEAA
jgi:hypothetical protein